MDTPSPVAVTQPVTDAGGTGAAVGEGGGAAAAVSEQPRAAAGGPADNVPPDVACASEGWDEVPADEYGEEVSCCSCLCCRMVCWFFCCPPIPSRIVAKQAFLPPDPPTYEIYEHEEGGDLRMRVEADGSQPGGAKVAVQPSQRGATLSVHWVPRGLRRRLAAHLVRVPGARYTLLFSHGNAVDIGVTLPYMLDLGARVGCNIFSYDYSGYGLSSGLARERGQYADVEAAWEHLTAGPMGVPPGSVVLYGMSIGSSPSVHLAAKLCTARARGREGVRLPAGVVLHSPVASGIRVLRPACKTTLCCDPFQNIHKVARVTVPTLVIHGERDDVVPVEHGRMLHAGLPAPAEPLWLQHADHNNIEAFKAYYTRLHAFFNELDAHAAKAAAESGGGGGGGGGE